MYKQLSGLLKNTLLYGSGDILEKGVAFLLVPVYTAFLSPDQYGIISLMALLISLLFIFNMSGQQGAVLRYYHQYRSSPGRQRVIIATIFCYLIAAPLLLSLLITARGESLFNLLALDIPFYPFGFLAVLTAYFMALPQLQLNAWMAGESPRKYIIFNLGRLAFTTALIVYFIAVLQWGAAGKMLAGAIGQGLFWLLALVLLLRYAGTNFSGRELANSLKYGLPLVPHLLANLLLSLSDRYMLKYFTGLPEVGIYTLGYTLGSIMFILAFAFDKAWFPFFFSRVESDEGQILFPKVATYFTVLSMFITLALAIFAPEIVSLMAAPAYSQASLVLPVVAFGVFFNCIYLVPVKAFFYYKKTKTIPLLTAAAAALNIALNLWLIPLYGMVGAAWATVFSYFLLFMLVLALSQKLYFIDYEIKRLISGLAAGAAVFALNLFIFSHIQVAPVQSLAIKSGLLICCVLLLYLFRFFDQREIKTFKSFLLKGLRYRR